MLPSHFAVVAFGLPAEGATQADPDEFIRKRSREGIDRFSRRALDESHFADFAQALFFVQGSFNDTRAYAQLKAKLDALDQQFGIPGSRVFYLAVPPQVVHLCVEHLQQAGMIRDPADLVGFTRVIVEKPIGRDRDRPARWCARSAPHSRIARRIASTTIWARKLCRTCWYCVSPSAPGYRKEVRNSFEIQPQSPAELVGRQLSDRERDPVFTQSMGVAQELARSLMD